MRIPLFIWFAVAIAAFAEILRAIWANGELALLPYIGIVGALLGLNLAWRSLFNDPFPGKDLCPKCFYDTDAIRGRTCPECGFEAPSSAVWRTRPRRWGLATLGLALVLGLPAVHFSKRAVAHGFWPAWPATALVVLLPALPADAWTELESRLLDDANTLSAWQRKSLAKQCAKTVSSERDMGIRLAALDLLMWLEPESVSTLTAFRAAVLDPDPFVADWAVTKCHSTWLARELATLIADDALSPSRRAEIIWAARFRRLGGPELTESLEKSLNDQNPIVREAAAEALSAQRESARRQNSGGGLGWNWVLLSGAVVQP